MTMRTKNFPSFPRARMVPIPMCLATLSPGESCTNTASVNAVFRLERLVAKLIPHPPDIKLVIAYYRVKGSKRRGRNMSNRWAIETLTHYQNLKLGIVGARVSIDNIMIGKRHQTTGNPIPLSFFSADGYPPDLSMDACKPGADIVSHYTNRELFRVVDVRVTGIGRELA